MGATELIPVTVPPDTYFGPVHEVEHTQRFVTVLVPEYGERLMRG